MATSSDGLAHVVAETSSHGAPIGIIGGAVGGIIIIATIAIIGVFVLRRNRRKISDLERNSTSMTDDLSRSYRPAVIPLKPSNKFFDQDMFEKDNGVMPEDDNLTEVYIQVHNVTQL